MIRTKYAHKILAEKLAKNFANKCLACEPELFYIDRCTTSMSLQLLNVYKFNVCITSMYV